MFTMGLVLLAEAGGGVFVPPAVAPHYCWGTVTHPSALDEHRGSSFRVSHKPLVGVTAVTVVDN